MLPAAGRADPDAAGAAVAPVAVTDGEGVGSFPLEAAALGAAV